MSQPLTPEQIKHLEMIQEIIKRLADNSFSVRRWTLVAVGALVAFAARDSEPVLAYSGAGLSLAFWVLDTYYLRQERIFRQLYNRVRREPDSVEPFAMWAQGLVTKRESYRSVMFSITELLVYAPTISVAVALGLAVELA